MVVSCPVRLRPYSLRLLLLASLPLLVGCSHAPPSATLSQTRSTPRMQRTAALVTLTPQQTALATVQALPLYQQARQACNARQFRRASDLLAQLAASSTLSAEQVAFVQEQRDLCLHDAGLPLEERKGEEEQRRKGEEATATPTPDTQHPTPSADCGPRALLLACERLGVKTTLPQLRKGAGTTAGGTSLAGLADAAKRMGLKAEGVQVSREAPGDVEMPALAYVNGNHFVAVLSVQGRGEGGTARIHDPNKGEEETISQERLLRLCSGYLLLVQK